MHSEVCTQTGWERTCRVQNPSQAGPNSCLANAGRGLAVFELCLAHGSLGLAPWGKSTEQQLLSSSFLGRLLRDTHRNGRRRHQIPHASQTFCLELLPQGFLHVLDLLCDHSVTEVIPKLLFQQHPDDFDAAFIHHGLGLPEGVSPAPRDGVALDVVGGEEFVEQSLAGCADFLVKPDGLFELLLGVAVEELHHFTRLSVGLLLEGQGFQSLHLLLQREDILLEV